MEPEISDRALTCEPEHILAITLYGEARGERTEGKIAVAHVIQNRQQDPRWPNSIGEVCIQNKQFSCWNQNDPNYPILVNKLFETRNTDPHKAWRECLWVAGGVLRGYLADNTLGANHYHTKSIRPSWSEKMTVTVEIGNHIFYRG